MAMAHQAFLLEPPFIKANAPGFAGEIIRPAYTASVRHDGNMAKALTAQWQSI